MWTAEDSEDTEKSDFTSSHEGDEEVHFFIFNPEGVLHTSPGQRPGKRQRHYKSPERARYKSTQYPACLCWVSPSLSRAKRFGWVEERNPILVEGSTDSISFGSEKKKMVIRFAPVAIAGLSVGATPRGCPCFSPPKSYPKHGVDPAGGQARGPAPTDIDIIRRKCRGILRVPCGSARESTHWSFPDNQILKLVFSRLN